MFQIETALHELKREASADPERVRKTNEFVSGAKVNLSEEALARVPYDRSFFMAVNRSRGSTPNRDMRFQEALNLVIPREMTITESGINFYFQNEILFPEIEKTKNNFLLVPYIFDRTFSTALFVSFMLFQDNDF